MKYAIVDALHRRLVDTVGSVIDQVIYIACHLLDSLSVPSTFSSTSTKPTLRPLAQLSTKPSALSSILGLSLPSTLSPLYFSSPGRYSHPYCHQNCYPPSYQGCHLSNHQRWKYLNQQQYHQYNTSSQCTLCNYINNTHDKYRAYTIP